MPPIKGGKPAEKTWVLNEAMKTNTEIVKVGNEYQQRTWNPIAVEWDYSALPPEGAPKKEGQNKFVIGQTIRLPEDRFLEITKLDHFGRSLHYGGTLATRRPGVLAQYDYVWMPASFIDAIGING